jgi:hypothetical protein
MSKQNPHPKKKKKKKLAYLKPSNLLLKNCSLETFSQINMMSNLTQKTTKKKTKQTKTNKDLEFGGGI